MDLVIPVITAVLVYALAPGASTSLMGQRVEPGASIPTGVIGVFLPNQGVVHLGEGARLSVAPARDELRLESGSIRVASSSVVAVLTPVARVLIGNDTVLLLTVDDGWVEVCAVRGNTRLDVLPSPPAEGTVVPGVAEGDNVNRRIRSGTCRRVDRATSAVTSGPLDREDALVLRRAAERALPPLHAAPDVIGDLAGHLEEIETEWSDALEQGPRREAASCGCAEDGSSGGGLDPGGGTGPDPEPERPDPGVLRVRIRLPSR